MFPKRYIIQSYKQPIWTLKNCWDEQLSKPQIDNSRIGTVFTWENSHRGEFHTGMTFWFRMAFTWWCGHAWFKLKLLFSSIVHGGVFCWRYNSVPLIRWLSVTPYTTCLFVTHIYVLFCAHIYARLWENGHILGNKTQVYVTKKRTYIV